MTAITTWLEIETEDSQHYKETVKIRVKDAAFGATTLPTRAKIEALVASMFGTTKVSDNKVLSYSVVVREDGPDATGGNGGAATAIAAKTRNDIGAVGYPDGFEIRIPGLAKNRVTFGVSDQNQISTVGALWDGIRTAISDADLGTQEPNGSAALADTDFFEEAVAFNGKRGSKKPR